MIKPKKKLHKELKTLWIECCEKKWGTRCLVCDEWIRAFHHYIPTSKSLFLKYSVENGVPLCIKHHYLIHFSHNPEETRRLCEVIRKKRGKEWVAYIEKHKRTPAKNSIWWLELVKKKLRRCLDD